MIIMVDGRAVARTGKSEVLGTTSKQEAEWFIEAYEELFPHATIEAKPENPVFARIMEERER